MKHEKLKAVCVLSISLLLVGCLATGQKVPVTELQNKKNINVSVEIYQTATVKAPTVILLHGCGGPERAHMKEWIAHLNEWGYNAVVPNLIQARGASQICDNPYRVITAEQGSVDAYEVAKWIKKQDWATDKVALIGFSFGAWATLYAAESGYLANNFLKTPFAAGIAFYPYCDPALMTGRKSAMPLQIHIGLADRWTPAYLCRAFAENWKIEDGYFEYEGAYHGFDMTGMNTFSYPDMFGKRHLIRHDRSATQLSRTRTKELLDKTLKDRALTN